MQTLRVLAPAKVNLFLGIGQRDADGYHAATSILHALMLHDTLSFYFVPPEQVSYEKEFSPALFELETCEEEGLTVGVETLWREGMEPVEIPVADNLVTRAVLAVARAYGFPQKGYLRVNVEKHIPLQAGLGGGSSDAAAALVACAQLWGISLEDEKLHEIARSLGADVAFFLRGGCGVYSGRGDVFERALETRKDDVLLVIPEGGVSTAEAYRTFDEDPLPVPADVEAAALAAARAADVPLFNNLEGAAHKLLPALDEVTNWANAAEGVREVLLSGSGSAVFCVCESPDAALRLAVDARAQGWRTRVTSFTKLRAQALPQERQTNLGATRV